MRAIPMSLVLVMAVSLGLAQNPADLFQKAPPDVEEALRSRITKFLQMHVEGKFRQAEALVAEDSKEKYYAANKQRLLSFEVSKITFKDEFTKAEATILCETFINQPGFAGRPIKIPAASLWKLENGEWYWYLEPRVSNMTPFGKMDFEQPRAGSDRNPPSGLANQPDLKTIFSQVKADKSEVTLQPGGKSSAQVTIKNEMPGPVSLSLEPKEIQGIAVDIDQPELSAGGQAVATFRSVEGRTPVSPTATVHIVVKQTGHTIPVRVLMSKN